MSSYIYFYIKGRKELVPVYGSSRNSTMYQNLYYELPYDKVRAVSDSELREFISTFENEVESYQKRIAREKEALERIPSFQNSLEEKLEAMDSIGTLIEEYEEEIAAAQNCIAVLRTLRGAIEAVRYNETYDVDKYIYAGVDCWRPPLAAVEKWERGEDVSEEEYENLKDSEN